LGTRRITAEQAVEIGELFNRHVRRTAEALQDLHEARRSTTAAQMISALEDTIERTLLSADEIPVDVNSPVRPRPPEQNVFMNRELLPTGPIQGMAGGQAIPDSRGPLLMPGVLPNRERDMPEHSVFMNHERPGRHQWYRWSDDMHRDHTYDSDDYTDHMVFMNSIED